jgi:glycosyltransferase involved in cell wall biosynthesis
MAIKSSKKITVSLVLIVRNELKSSRVIFPRIPKKSVDAIYVIDGHSTDGTQAFFKKKKIPVYEQTIPGLGGATFKARKVCKTDAMIFFHPDGNENPEDIEIVSNYLKRGEPFVIPSRMILGSWNEEDIQLLRPRKWFNKCMAFVSNFLWNNSNSFPTDIVQGFRGISVKAFDTLHLDKTDCTIDFQMFIRALKYGVPIFEFPTKEGDRLFGTTSFGSIDTGIKEMKMFFREFFVDATYPSKHSKKILKRSFQTA